MKSAIDGIGRPPHNVRRRLRYSSLMPQRLEYFTLNIAGGHHRRAARYHLLRQVKATHFICARFMSAFPIDINIIFDLPTLAYFSISYNVESS